jgi:hypothetical protein
MAGPNELNADQILGYLASRQPALDRAPAHVQPYRDAAAVLVAIRNLKALSPLGSAPAGRAADLLGPDLIPATGAAFHGEVMLSPEVRAQTIRVLVATRRLDAALAANPSERDGPLQTHFERYLRRDAPLLEEQSLAELDATLQVSVWLAGVIDGVPPVATVEARAGYKRLLAPFETLAGDDVFRGRRRELDRLRRYIGVIEAESTAARVRDAFSRWALPERQPAVSISGIGGAGKSSLVARFMLEHTRLPDPERIPFGYLDFARVSLDVGDLIGLSAELLHQLDFQFPELGLAKGFRSLERWLAAKGSGLPQEDEMKTARLAHSALADALRTLADRLGPRPYVIVLDTFEEVQYRGEERAIPLWQLLAELQDSWQFLRVVVAGRVPVESLRLADRPPRRIDLGDLDDSAAAAFLKTQGIGDPRVQSDIIDTFGRLPLSLKLVTSLAKRTPGGAAALVGPGAGGLSTVSATDEVIQAQLYWRFLDRIPDVRVRRLAHPGLTLRRINPALILNVLNEPCGLQIKTIGQASALFEELRRESSLVSVDSADGDLVHRLDLRRVMVKMLLTGAPAVTRQIHENAVDWYKAQRGSRAAAEHAYHALQLGNPGLLRGNNRDPLRDVDVRASLQAAIDEFPVDMQLWLAGRGLKVPGTVRTQASRDQAHAAVAAQIEDLLPYGESAVDEANRVFRAAYQTLRPGFRSTVGLGDRGASPVFRSGARIAAQRGNDEDALALIAEGLERASRDGAAELTLGLLKERAWLCRDTPPKRQEEGLALLAEHARRHQDLAAQIQHQAQWTYIRHDDTPDNLSILFNLLTTASARILWDLLPALERPIKDVGRFDPSLTLLTRLPSLLVEPSSPFQSAVFPDRWRQSSLIELLNALDPESHGGAEAVRQRYEFQSRFLDLCKNWPYRVLYTAPPQGRRGDRLTVTS